MTALYVNKVLNTCEFKIPQSNVSNVYSDKIIGVIANVFEYNVLSIIYKN